ncbi:MAG TPA: general secretion pathway protein GspH [Solidesulfovibrio sp.]|nr:general secretion pathway protein GspH [Solidesulfovibrio sp.]
MMQSGGHKGAAGFSALEGVAVLLLVGILAVAAVVKYGKTGSRAIAEADGLRSVLRYAQSRAMADVYTWGVSFNASGYALFSNNPSQSGHAIPGQGSNTHTLASGVSLSGTSPIIFDWRGQPVKTTITTPGGWAAPQTAYQYITVSESGGSANVTITPYTGFVP